MRTRRSTMTLALAVVATGLAACEDGTGIESVEDQMTIDAAMLEETRLAPHFKVTGDRSTHFGTFDCGSGADGKPDTKTCC